MRENADRQSIVDSLRCCSLPGLLLSLAGLFVTTPALLYAAEEALIPQEESPIEVSVTGAPEELAENLKAYLPSLRVLDCESGSERIDSFIQSSYDKLAEGAEAMGYFSAKFEVKSVRSRGDGCWRLNIAVEPGLPVRVRNIAIKVSGEGRKQEDFSELMTELPYEKGDVFVNQPYEDFKKELSSTAGSLGYFDAEFIQRRILVNVDDRTADIELHFKTGERYEFGEVNVEQDVLAERFIERYIVIEKGKAYDSDELLRQRRILETSGYYKDVQVTTRFDAAENQQVPVAIVTQRRDRYSYTANIGYASDTNLRIETGMEAHWVNQRGHKMSGKLRLSQNDPALGVVYKVPLWNPEHEFASLSFDWSLSDNDDIKGEKLELELNYNRRNDSGWQQTAFVSFLDEKTQVDNEPEVHSQLTLLGARVSKTKSDDALFPTEGWRARAEVKGAHDSILSDLTLLQLKIDGKYLYTFEHSGKLLARGSFGSTLIDDFQQLPKSLRFFTGGQNSVRGYGFESIGTRDAEGNVVGGQYLVVASAEYEYPITETISAAAFVDAGSAFDEWDNYDFKVGAGFGARYKSPLGPIRLDLAVPEDDPSDVHFYFSLGPDL